MLHTSLGTVALTSLLVVWVGCGTSSEIGRVTDRSHPRVTSSSPYPHFKEEIDALFSDSLFPPSNVGMKVVSLATREILYDLNSRFLFIPGSNQKLLTSAAALNLLGAEYELNTPVYFDTINGNRIIVKGGGDPLLSTADIDSLAGSIVTSLPRDRTWTLIGDVSFFDDMSWGKGWMWDDEPDPTSMHISPLSVNGNAIKVLVKPGALAGEPVIVTTDPTTGYVSVDNSAMTVVDSAAVPLKISRLWIERSNVITITGEMKIGDTARTENLSVYDPASMFLTLLAERLRLKGIQVDALAQDTLVGAAVEIARDGHRLDSVITYMNQVSDNLAAENVLKTMGAERFGPPGDGIGGITAVKEYLSRIGIDTLQMTLADGSGISRYNLLSAGTIVQLLSSMHGDPVFYSSLPVAGRTGSLSRRMKNTPAEGRLRAKTGTLSGVTTLSGYTTNEDGETLAFAILMQNFPGSVRNYRLVQDRIGILLTTLKRE